MKFINAEDWEIYPDSEKCKKYMLYITNTVYDNNSFNSNKIIKQKNCGNIFLQK